MKNAPSSLADGLPQGARRLLSLALTALARREHSRLELERKLRDRLEPDETAADLQAALDRLQAKGLLSDERLAQVVARVRQARYGRVRIRRELERRGVDRASIAAALPQPEDEAATAWALWQRKFGVPPADARARARQGRFLVARGFDSALVARILARAALGSEPANSKPCSLD